MTTLDVLIKARKLLSDPRRWGKGAFVRTQEDGIECYCALGAIGAAAGNDLRNEPGWNWNDAYRDAQFALRLQVPAMGYSVSGYNDDDATSYEDIMRLFSDAIQAEVEA